MVQVLGVLAIGGGVVLLLRVLNINAGGGGGAQRPGDFVYDAVEAQVAQGIPARRVGYDANGLPYVDFAVNNVTPADPGAQGAQGAQHETPTMKADSQRESRRSNA